VFCGGFCLRLTILQGSAFRLIVHFIARQSLADCTTEAGASAEQGSHKKLPAVFKFFLNLPACFFYVKKIRRQVAKGATLPGIFLLSLTRLEPCLIDRLRREPPPSGGNDSSIITEYSILFLILVAILRVTISS